MKLVVDGLLRGGASTTAHYTVSDVSTIVYCTVSGDAIKTVYCQ